MLPINAQSFIRVVSNCERVAMLVQTVDKSLKIDLDAKLGDEVKMLATGSLNEIKHYATAIGAKASSEAAKRLVANMNEIDGRKFGEANKDLASRFYDELTGVNFLYLDGRSIDYFEPNLPLFGEEVNLKFPEASFEIDEAGKCIALGRYTAAVFHLMGCLETAIKALARSLGIDDPISDNERNWGKILQKIKDDMHDRTNKVGQKRWKRNADKSFFQEAHVLLDGVRSVWRNGTMHVENKYTHEEAEHIFVNTRAFMRKVASRLDNQGKPRA